MWNEMWCWLSGIISQLWDCEAYILGLCVCVALLVMCNISSGIQLGELGRYFERGRGGNGVVLVCSELTASAGPDNNQSPINLETACYTISYFDMPLEWAHYDDLPVGIRLENNGRTILLRAAFQNQTPFIDGGDLLGPFVFHEICFRWSWYNTSGSEHTVNNQHFPLEMQCLHTDTDSPDRASSQSILMISFMFALSQDNPYLDVLVQHLAAVQEAGRCVELPPFPLSYLIQPFYSNFVSYRGSLTEPPYHRGVEWFIWPYPLAIGERQLNEFRQLRNRHGARISCNGRPVQQLQDRRVYYNAFRR